MGIGKNNLFYTIHDRPYPVIVVIRFFGQKNAQMSKHLGIHSRTILPFLLHAVFVILHYESGMLFADLLQPLKTQPLTVNTSAV